MESCPVTICPSRLQLDPKIPHFQRPDCSSLSNSRYSKSNLYQRNLTNCGDKPQSGQCRSQTRSQPFCRSKPDKCPGTTIQAPSKSSSTPKATTTQPPGQIPVSGRQVWEGQARRATFITSRYRAVCLPASVHVSFSKGALEQLVLAVWLLTLRLCQGNYVSLNRLLP